MVSSDAETLAQKSRCEYFDGIDVLWANNIDVFFELTVISQASMLVPLIDPYRTKSCLNAKHIPPTPANILPTVNVLIGSALSTCFITSHWRELAKGAGLHLVNIGSDS